MRKCDPLDQPTADKSAIKCFDCPYLTEMARLESQSVVRVEEISKKRTTKQYIQNLWRVHPRERWQTTLYRAAKKRFDCTKIWSRRIRHFLNLGTVFFSTQIRADGALRVVWRVVSKRCYFGELNQFRAVKNKHLRLQKYPDSCEPGLKHTVETVDCQQSLGIIARVCMLNATEQGKRAREKTERIDGSVYFFCLCTSSLLDWLLFRVLLSLNPTDWTCTASV